MSRRLEGQASKRIALEVINGEERIIIRTKGTIARVARLVRNKCVPVSLAGETVDGSAEYLAEHWGGC